ncbi:hypothetical protein BC941DRAFT_508545 [Chlamydoabsidia padenii]|nr:hypothetical protein BC941DRAFT_508545 [Chlamydoabsidia padenii]
MFTSLIYTPTKRIFSCNDEFFKEGNIALRAYWLERDAATETDVNMIRQEANTLSTSFQSRPIFCELPSCIQRHGGPVSFPTLVAYEAHYEAQHRNHCSICHLSFPGAHWLELHLDEQHNVLNQIRKDRGDKIYKCYVETCGKHFSVPKMRRLHLIDKHRYPKFFPFDLVVTGTRSIEQRPRRPTKDHSPTDMEIDALTMDMSRIKLPLTVSFGRGRKQVWHRSSYQSSHKKTVQIDDRQQLAPTPNRRERRLAASITKKPMDLE